MHTDPVKHGGTGAGRSASALLSGPPLEPGSRTIWFTLTDFSVQLAERRWHCNVQGEITLVIEGAPEAGPESFSQEELLAALQQALDAGHSASSAVKVVRASTGAPKRELYPLAVQLAGQQEPPISEQ